MNLHNFLKVGCRRFEVSFLWGIRSWITDLGGAGWSQPYLVAGMKNIKGGSKPRSPDNTWPRRPGLRLVVPCTWPASWTISTFPPSSAPVTPPRFCQLLSHAQGGPVACEAFSHGRCALQLLLFCRCGSARPERNAIVNRGVCGCISSDTDRPISVLAGRRPVPPRLHR